LEPHLPAIAIYGTFQTEILASRDFRVIQVVRTYLQGS
jgi:hypothetical protein